MKRGARHRRKSKALAKTLIATTLAAGAAGAVEATPFNELDLAADDFADTFATADALPVGTDEVTGTNDDPFSGFAEQDFFKFSGLEGLQTFELVAERTGGTFFTSVGVRDSDGTLLDPAGGPLETLNSINSPVSSDGNVPH